MADGRLVPPWFVREVPLPGVIIPLWHCDVMCVLQFTWR